VVLLLKNLAFTLLLPGTLGVYLPLWITQGPARPAGAAGAGALALLALGGAIYAWCVWDFATFGGGTPAPIDAPKRVVARGLYRFTRNPMYVGVLTVILGIAALHRSPAAVAYAAVVATGFHLFVRLYEEPHLRRVFGAEYEAYCARVNRWLPKRAA
jgi:protein-S-isoprenylcysteine O-methyltransferase Ste14